MRSADVCLRISLLDQLPDLAIVENRAVAAYVAMADGTVIAFPNATLHHAFQGRNDRFFFEPERKEILDNDPDHDGRPTYVRESGLRVKGDLFEQQWDHTTVPVQPGWAESTVT